MEIKDILKEIKSGNFQIAYEYDATQIISDSVIRILNESDDNIKADPDLLQLLVDLISIGNITYNYSDADILPIEDSIYDMLVVKLQRIDYSKFTPGAIPVDINLINSKFESKIDRKTQEKIKPFTIMSADDMAKLEYEMFYPSILMMNKPFDPRANLEKPFMTSTTGSDYVNKRLRNTAHNYPNLVGTLEKCKIVLNKQADELGMLDQPNVTILERDFFVPLLQRGIINNVDTIRMVGTLKYDGISVEADCTDEIISARTRGDTDYNVASDLTPILQGYKFPNARKLDKPIGIKFEAIVLYDDLKKINQFFGKSYINGRTAIIGIMGSSDARKLRDFITLVPIQADFGPNVVRPTRLDEIEFLNKYYANREYLRWVYIENTYTNLMFMIKKYVEEAEYFRTWSRFMYDGVVLEFIDPDIINILGRKNSINQYQMAVKFNPLKRITIFTGYTYTVGQNGAITPMIHYTPIEFLGSIHTKSTGSSYERFNDLNLFIGDQIEVTYVNDVMPYVTKPDIEFNRINHQREPKPEELFPTHCPSCGAKLKESAQGKTMYCPNMNCSERTIQRLTNMLMKLDIKDFSQAAIEALATGGRLTLKKLITLSMEDLEILGPTNKVKFYSEMQKLITNPLPDYRIIGALGFTNIAAKKWVLIFKKYPLRFLFHVYLCEKDYPNIEDNVIIAPDGTMHDNLRSLLANIKGVGPITAETIINELPFFEEDIDWIIQNGIYIETPIGAESAKYQIRFTGFRDSMLAAVLDKFPFIDCDGDASVTKKTTILLVPDLSFKSGKIDKALKYGVKVLPVKDFLENPGMYIPELDQVEFQ